MDSAIDDTRAWAQVNAKAAEVRRPLL